MSDLVNHPSHYEEQSIKLEPIDFCERLPFCEGNAIKYCFRAGHKEGASELLDLKKAQWYLNRRRSETALDMCDEDRSDFQRMTWFFRRSKGILSTAIDRWASAPIYEGDFWQVLEMCIDERIEALETDKAPYEQTIGSKK